ncbi:helix-turn-helix transcriptional regulator [Aromatoleum buckelii]|uniref:AlpA family phage regulatory protein n=1 Tax=Aromatoleum buckelii TaxID=200254 RepID=A0ABX1N3Q0_9RHOO|nr:AlpA family phage regulatory protein [Aromatoleum buckelii]MCK0509838.1 AlpA family transcriptional regulator [Aromatoleum buckelii]
MTHTHEDSSIGEQTPDQWPAGSRALHEAKVLPLKRTIRRDELRRMVPLADSTIYLLEKKGEFPQRFNLTSRCVVWDYDEVVAWIVARRDAALGPAPGPDVRKRRARPVRA